MDEYIGKIVLLAYKRIPMDYLPCLGQALPIVQYQALYALIGNTYGGDGRTTFALPNLQGAEPVPGMQYCIVVNGIFPS